MADKYLVNLALHRREIPRVGSLNSNRLLGSTILVVGWKTAVFGPFVFLSPSE